MAKDIYFNQARINWYNEWHIVGVRQMMTAFIIR